MNDDDSNSSGGEVLGTGNDERIARLNAIADQADNDRAEELANVNDDGSTEPFRAAAEPEPEQEAAPEAETPKEPEERRYRLKVNGREVELTEAELVARAQKIESADEYLRQAAETKRRLEQTAAPPLTRKSFSVVKTRKIERSSALYKWALKKRPLPRCASCVSRLVLVHPSAGTTSVALLTNASPSTPRSIGSVPRSAMCGQTPF